MTRRRGLGQKEIDRAVRDAIYTVLLKSGITSQEIKKSGISHYIRIYLTYEKVTCCMSQAVRESYVINKMCISCNQKINIIARPRYKTSR